ncbi:MAG: cytochrome b/b6 domain-containing protein, partial [Acidilobaceae archaeon]
VFGSEIPMDIKRGIGRHNVLASYLTLLLIFGVLMVSLSGVAMVYLSLTPDQYRLMLLIHDIGFYIIMIFLVGHLFAVFHPKNVILLNAMFGDGKVPLEWAKDEMPAYIEKLRKA